jgi:hypothetical protein
MKKWMQKNGLKYFSLNCITVPLPEMRNNHAQILGVAVINAAFFFSFFFLILRSGDLYIKAIQKNWLKNCG